MKTQHTQGPWSLEYDYSLVMPAKDGNHIVTGGPIGPDGASREEKQANMKLIAAAPELLQALQDMLDITRFQYKEMATYKYAQEIINKATKP